jgi:ABC-type transport system involved in cytochrome bd biosynthesis fused ATPase/permease subunit
MNIVRDDGRDYIALTRQVLDLYQASVDLMRQNLRRRHPEASEERIQELLLQWKLHRPGAALGDVGGPIRVRERPIA